MSEGGQRISMNFKLKNLLNFIKSPNCTLLRININAEDFIEIIMQSVLVYSKIPQTFVVIN